MADGYFKTKNYNVKSSRNSIAGIADRVFNSTKEVVVNRGWGPLVVLARTAVVALMEKITEGQLRVLTPEAIYTFGSPSSRVGELKAELRVVNDAFWVRLMLQSDIGFAEAYMMGDVESDDLDKVFRMFIINRSNLSEMSTTTSAIFSSLNFMMNSRFVNSVSNAISNISAHYDISNQMFAAFLSRDMTYSCAFFGPEEGGINGDLIVSPTNSNSNFQKPQVNGIDTKAQFRDLVGAATRVTRAIRDADNDELEAAQLRKLDLIIRKAKIGRGDRVLEIGSGWGSFSIRAVQTCGCKVDTLTLSIEQKNLAEERIKAAGLEGEIVVHLLDYRNIPREWEGRFDRVVSIEMIEAVGLEYLETYFGVVDRALKRDRGVAVFQVITIPEARFDRYKNEPDFIRRYIFPGGLIPSVTFMTDTISKGSKNTLILESIENIGPHYARTLREWERRFSARFDSEIVPALREAYPEIKSNKEIEVFRRKWIYYFEYCQTGFAMRVLGDHVFTVTREGNLSLDA